MAPIFETAMLLAVAILPAALVSANCTANILNINEVVIATGCVPAGGNLIIRVGSDHSYLIRATVSCGLSLNPSQSFINGESLASGGRC
uniref:Toxb n=3 Tax=Pyrenophora tritici-repentis TaxID=45151 RepID=Q8J0U6_9PLEO|nr:toxb precursor [Pyrenophora tritici-repentis]QLB38403.1 ToxB [Pyrenophora tritici-repentis]QLB38404.1 ToxB [Pyrenophora tritici-repentis]QLB38405.1 ToxB [Pyrenophora tritici-repentis]QLB38406.1 ToxB [Pyrenophora tritici-repentis]